MAGVTAAGAAAPRWAFAGPYEQAEWPIPTDKKLSLEWIESLTARGAPKLYTGLALEHIGMPVGGIGCGLVYLSGDGRLWHWDVFNYGIFGVYEGRFPYKGDQVDSGGGAAYLDPPKPKSPFEIGVKLRVEDGPTVGMDRSGWESVTFHGRYPVGTVRYSTPGAPLHVELEAFSPFAPLETDDSSLPLTVLRYRITNTGDKPVKGNFDLRCQNPVLMRSGRKETTVLGAQGFGGPAHQGTGLPHLLVRQ